MPRTVSETELLERTIFSIGRAILSLSAADDHFCRWSGIERKVRRIKVDTGTARSHNGCFRSHKGTSTFTQTQTSNSPRSRASCKVAFRINADDGIFENLLRTVAILSLERDEYWKLRNISLSLLSIILQLHIQAALY